MTFMEDALVGVFDEDLLEDHFVDAVKEWHDSDEEETRDLHEFLGMTWHEYSLCAVKPSSIVEVVKRREEREKAEELTIDVLIQPNKESNKLLTLYQTLHEANRAIQEMWGEDVSLPWIGISNHQYDSLVDAVGRILSGEVDNPRQLHEAWKAYKIKCGWVYGEEKNEALLTHPCLVDNYDDLPWNQKYKDYVFFNIVQAYKQIEEDM